jgi:hypothetical protein
MELYEAESFFRHSHGTREGESFQKVQRIIIITLFSLWRVITLCFENIFFSFFAPEVPLNHIRFLSRDNGTAFQKEEPVFPTKFAIDFSEFVEFNSSSSKFIDKDKKK